MGCITEVTRAGRTPQTRRSSDISRYTTPHPVRDRRANLATCHLFSASRARISCSAAGIRRRHKIYKSIHLWLLIPLDEPALLGLRLLVFYFSFPPVQLDERGANLLSRISVIYRVYISGIYTAFRCKHRFPRLRNGAVSMAMRIVIDFGGRGGKGGYFRHKGGCFGSKAQPFLDILLYLQGVHHIRVWMVYIS